MLFLDDWYPLAQSSKVDARPQRVRALGQDLVLFRRASDRQVVVLSDLCVHRCASLALGRVEGDTIRCPYHGWRYDSDGRCVEVPANPPGARVPKRARVDAYPVEERFGLVWAFLGDAPESARPPLPEFPEYGRPGWRAVWGEATWAAHYTRVVENTVDVAHTPFIHANTFGNADEPEMPPYEVRSDGRTLSATVRLASPRPRGPTRFVMGGASTHEVDLGITLPATNRLGTAFQNGWRLVLLFCHLPVDEHTTRSFFVQLRNFLPFGFADGFSRRFSLLIVGEDRATVESQQPAAVPLRPDAELSTRSDLLSIEYRKALKARADAAGIVDDGAVQRASRDGRLLVLPSPARREPDSAGTWVLAPVPVTAPRSPVPDVAQELLERTDPVVDTA